MSKKILTLFMAMILCLSFVLQACNGDGANEPDGSETESESETEEEKPREVISIDKSKNYKLENTIDVYKKGDLGKDCFRIPTMITTENGVVITAIDRGHNADSGDISIAVRRSPDGGKTWEDSYVLLDPPYGSDAMVNKGIHSLVIDPLLVEDRQDNKVHMIVSFYPESAANIAYTYLEQGTGYKKVNGEDRLILRDHTFKDTLAKKTWTKEYTLGSDGVVYDEKNKKTEYTVPSFMDGTIYKNGKSAGNIFLYSGDNAGDFTVVSTSYVLSLYSEDDGKTWSEPVCINAQVKPAKGTFSFGVGPGVGLQLESGRLVVPMWCMLGTCVIYSDDHGKTWERGDFVPRSGTSESQLIELTGKDGKKVLKLFGRDKVHPYVCTSYDGGKTWDSIYRETQLNCPDCQFSLLLLPFDVEGYEGKQVLIYNGCGDAYSRINGTARVGIYDPETDSFEWIKSKLYATGSHIYSCLSVLPGNRIGLIYEISLGKIVFTTYHIGYLFK